MSVHPVEKKKKKKVGSRNFDDMCYKMRLFFCYKLIINISLISKRDIYCWW